MSFVKRAFLYVFRKWRQSLITFLILSVVCTAALIGLAVWDASDAAAANLRGQFGGSFSLKLDMSNPANMKSAGAGYRYTGSYYDGDRLDDAVIDEILKTPGIAAYSAGIKGVANLKSREGLYCSLAENVQNYYSSANVHAASIQGWTSLEQCSYFAEGFLQVTEGAPFTGETLGQAVISRELAEKNGIAVGDPLTLEINRELTGLDIPAEKGECVFEVVGLFDILGEQQIGPYTGQRQMIQNWVFVDSRTLLAFENELLKSMGERPIGYDKVTFSVRDPAEMDAIVKEIRQNPAIDPSCFKIEVDNENYQNAREGLNGVNGSVRVMILAVVPAGIVILVLLSAILARHRVREAGVMLALGRSRLGILAQRMTETALIATLAFAVSAAAGGLIADSVGNLALKQANERNFSRESSGSLPSGTAFTSGDVNLNPVFAAPVVEELTVTVKAGTAATVYVSGLLTSMVCVCAAGIPVMMRKPREILSRMS